MIELSIRDNPKELAKIFLENIREIKKEKKITNPWKDKVNSDKNNSWIKKDKNKASEWEL